MKPGLSFASLLIVAFLPPLGADHQVAIGLASDFRYREPSPRVRDWGGLQWDLGYNHGDLGVNLSVLHRFLGPGTQGSLAFSPWVADLKTVRGLVNYQNELWSVKLGTLGPGPSYSWLWGRGSLGREGEGLFSGVKSFSRAASGAMGVSCQGALNGQLLLWERESTLEATVHLALTPQLGLWLGGLKPGSQRMGMVVGAKDSRLGLRLVPAKGLWALEAHGFVGTQRAQVQVDVQVFHPQYVDQRSRPPEELFSAEARIELWTPGRNWELVFSGLCSGPMEPSPGWDWFVLGSRIQLGSRSWLWIRYDHHWSDPSDISFDSMVPPPLQSRGQLDFGLFSGLVELKWRELVSPEARLEKLSWEVSKTQWGAMVEMVQWLSPGESPDKKFKDHGLLFDPIHRGSCRWRDNGDREWKLAVGLELGQHLGPKGQWALELYWNHSFLCPINGHGPQDAEMHFGLTFTTEF